MYAKNGYNLGCNTFPKNGFFWSIKIFLYDRDAKFPY